MRIPFFSSAIRGTTASFRTGTGEQITIRPLRPGDKECLIALLTGLSRETIYARYMIPVSFSYEAAAREACRLLNLVRQGDLVLVAALSGTEDDLLVAVGELVHDHYAPGLVEMGLLVADSYQRRGIGREIGRRIAIVAKECGAPAIHATVLYQNYPLLRLVRSLGVPHTISGTGEMLDIEIHLSA